MNKQKWILLVEDNENDADLALRALSVNEAPDDVVTARDGVEALDCLYHRTGFTRHTTGNPTVVLLDLKMPRMNGLEVLKHVKTDPCLQTIPVVMLTSSREEADVVRSYRLGVNAYVVKPVDFHAFVTALKEIKYFWTVLNEPPPDDADTVVVPSPAASAVA